MSSRRIPSLVFVALAGVALSASPGGAQELCGSWEIVDGFQLGEVTSLTDLAVIG